MNNGRTSFNTVLGLAMLGSFVVGFAGLLAALVTFIDGDNVAVGLCLGAAALAFGLLSNAILKD
jgi:uncharacterized membrane protein YjfL (UPF0719 family)